MTLRLITDTTRNVVDFIRTELKTGTQSQSDMLASVAALRNKVNAELEVLSASIAQSRGDINAWLDHFEQAIADESHARLSNLATIIGEADESATVSGGTS